VRLEIIHRNPKTETHAAPLLFVHGMWHAAWCWAEKFQPYFAERGYTTHAVSLRGHGQSEGRNSVRMAPLKAFVSDVAQAAEGLTRPPVLVGHSMGGMVVQRYLENHRAPAAVLLGSAPPRGLLPATMRLAAKHPVDFCKVNLTFNLQHTISTPERYREFFYSEDFPERELKRYHEIVKEQDESMRAFLDMVCLALPRPKRVRTKMLVLGSADDNLIYPQEVISTAKAYNTKAEFFVGMGHAMMLDTGWREVAEKILEWLRENGI
jgi:pimeloyl-ACP methyl ester carboxylesterase